ncbi:MAG TPA: transcription termination/antitermination protein NusG [Opitutales bacterium]|nr:transcription termination/antitermination protein NusG [Opitutales bacterium]
MSDSSPTNSNQTSGMKWYVVQTLSGREERTKQYLDKFKRIEELEDYIGEVLVPTEVVSEVKQGKKTQRTRKFYPSYVFVQARLYDENRKLNNKPWYFIREAPGVIGVVGGDSPSPLRESEIAHIRSQMEQAEGKEVPKIQYEVEEEVKITDGPFLNLTGRIDEIDPERGKLKVSVSIFGRFTPVELEYWQVERITS